MGTGYIGFKGVHPEERDKLRQALRDAHFTVAVVDDYVLVQSDDIVPVVEIYRRTCKKQAGVFHVHLSDEELAEVEREMLSGEPSRKTQMIAAAAQVKVAQFHGLDQDTRCRLVEELAMRGYAPALDREGTVLVEYRKDHEVDLKLIVERATGSHRRVAGAGSRIFLN